VLKYKVLLTLKKLVEKVKKNSFYVSFLSMKGFFL
jgi:hypothetical protein